MDMVTRVNWCLPKFLRIRGAVAAAALDPAVVAKSQVEVVTSVAISLVQPLRDNLIKPVVVATIFPP